MPLEYLGELLSYAEHEEKQAEREKAERQLYPLWLIHYTMAKVSGNEPVDYDKFINVVFAESHDTAEKTMKRTADDIISELMPFVEADREKVKT